MCKEAGPPDKTDGPVWVLARRKLQISPATAVKESQGYCLGNLTLPGTAAGQPTKAALLAVYDQMARDHDWYTVT